MSKDGIFDHRITVGLVVSVVLAMLTNAGAGIWFASSLTNDVRRLQVDVQEAKVHQEKHEGVGAHRGADVRIAKLEAVVEVIAEQGRRNTEILIDIRRIMQQQTSK